VKLKNETITGFRLSVGGMHNVENVTAAIAATLLLDIDTAKVKSAVADYKGVKRRFEYIIPPEKNAAQGYVKPVLIDDYAHHPEELNALLTSVRSLFPKRWITVIFQPHLFSRTRDLADGFASSLSIADEVLLLPIYPARELPVPGITSQLILDKITTKNKQIVTKENLERILKEQVKQADKRLGEVYVIAGAGDIDTLVSEIKKIII
ncbi:MAG TPA: cyanophycin synthetase, partial [Flavisolibacter sp.]|nr:cyanophycin synthetase [Flavisolibacter sp.]